MDEEQSYIDYVLMFSLSILTVSAAFFIDISNPLTLVTLIMVPLTFGYTTYTSRNGFQKSSLASLIGLFFLPVGTTTAVVGMLVAFGNPLVSAFSGGERFHDFFRAVSMPLLIVGIIISGTGYYFASTNPEIKNQMRDQSASILGDGTETFIQDSGIVGQYQNSQLQVVEATSTASVQMTRYHVLNQTRDDLDREELNAVSAAFDSAEQQIPTRLTNNADSQINTTEIDYSESVSGVVEKNFNDKMLLALIPLGTILIYSLNPLLGILNALSALGFRALDQRYGVF